MVAGPSAPGAEQTHESSDTTLPPPTPRATDVIALLATSTAHTQPTAADAAKANECMRFATVGAQRDTLKNQQALAALSLTVGDNAWVQLGVGQSRSQGTAAAHSPGLFTAGLGLAGDALRFTLNTTQRRDGRVYRQTDLGLVAGLAAGNRQHRRRRHEPTLACRKHRAAGQLARTLLARALAVNRDEAALDRSAQVGATYRTSSVAFDGEYTADKVHGGGTLRSLTLKVTIDMAPGWRVVPGFGQSRSDVGARVNYAMVSATYGS